MKILCVLGRHYYGDPARGEGYEHRNFLPALRALGHELEVFDSFSRREHADFAALNRALIDHVLRWQPDLLLCVPMGYEVWLETLACIRASGVRLLAWGTDDSWKYAEFTRFLAPAFDLWATTSHTALEAARRDGHGNVVASQWAASHTELAAPVPAARCRYPVSFVGSAYGNRPRWIAALAERGIEVACFGHGWPAGPVPAGQLQEIIRTSVLSLNFGDSGLVLRGLRPTRNRQLKARVFEVTGAGGCLLTEPSNQLESFFVPGRELAVFRDADELAGCIRHLLAHPAERDAMALAGQARTAAEHTYEARFRSLLAALPPVRPRQSLDLSAFEAAAGRYPAGTGLRLLGRLLAWPFERVWGRPRGTRAARRVLFELSWRVAGARTYGAAGWPGRLFYRES
jgi:spore maturation protein CgeB